MRRAVVLFVILAAAMPALAAVEWTAGPIVNDSPIFSPYEYRPPVRMDYDAGDRAGWDYRYTSPPGVTPVENQNPCDNCWIFAMCGLLEGRLRYFDASHPVLDFSELYFRECATPEYTWACSTFGQVWMLSSRLTAFEPLVPEGCAPWPGSSAEYTCATDFPTCSSYPYRLRSFVYCDDSVQDIKDALAAYGPIYCGVDAGHANFYTNTGSFISGPTSSTSNHAVLIVGWDDDLGGAGVPGWIVKNSWGTGFGDAGYCYMAYNALNIGVGALAVTEVEPPLANQDMTLYFHDDHGATQTLGVAGYTNHHVAARYVPTAPGEIARVEFATFHDDLTYEIRIYNDRTGGDTSSTLTSQLGSTVYGTAAKAGYYSIDLPSSIVRSAGDDFYVAMSCTIPTANYPLTIDGSGTDSNESWINLNGAAGNWTRAGAGGVPQFDACLRAVMYEGPATPATTPFGLAVLVLGLGALVARRHRR